MFKQSPQLAELSISSLSAPYCEGMPRGHFSLSCIHHAEAGRTEEFRGTTSALAVDGNANGT